MTRPVNILQHAVVDHHLAKVRDESTPPNEFRRRMRSLATLLLSEALRQLPQRSAEVSTPLESTACKKIDGRIAAVPILRAGLVLVEPLLELLPESEVRHLGMYRDEQTAQPVHYYNKLPSDNPPQTALVLDPMLATGGSAVAAIRELQQWGVPDIRMLAVIAAPEGIARVQHDCPEVSIFSCAVDRELNDQKYILPGLGDAGDRIFGT